MPWRASSIACTSPGSTTTGSPPSWLTRSSSARIRAAVSAEARSGWFDSATPSSSRITSQPSTSLRTTFSAMRIGYPAPRAENGSELGVLGVRAEDRLHCRDELAFGDAHPGRLDQPRHQVLPRFGGSTNRGQCGVDLALVALGLGPVEPRALTLLGRRVGAVDVELGLALELELVHPDHDPLLRVDLALIREGGVGDLPLGEAVLDRFDHPAELVDAVEVLIGSRLHLVGEPLDEVGAAERVGRVGDPGFVRDHLLGA